ncbi:MAG: glycosyltransferase [Bacteroidetes bacterium]|jgi:glycosyltransferase involved in cell wall biosynthesis|nr:glycosyltransferase [Bacteroidota bacterium]
MEKPILNILMIAPLSVGVVHGGVRMQSLKTAAHLRELSHVITYYSPWNACDPADFDLTHVFLASNETLAVSQQLRSSKGKFVVSPVFFTRRSSATIRRSLKIQSIGSKLFKGFFSDYSIKSEICHAADLVLPNTHQESELITNGFGVPESKVRVIPNGVDQRFETATPDLFKKTYGLTGFTLFVGDGSARRKNLYPLLKHHTSDDPDLVVIGRLDNSSYSGRCREIIDRMENIHYIGPLPHDGPMLKSAYAAAAVFVQPSQFETPGIAALEAALAGCSLAVTRVGGTKEYFGGHAQYIDPENEQSIMKAVRRAHQETMDETLKMKIKQHYTWKEVAAKTAEAYKTIL